MKPLLPSPQLAEQVRDALLADITAGTLAPGSRVIQEHIARSLGVSRQPVQQALLLLRNQGVLREAPGRGLEVVALQPQQVRHIYELRAAVEALAARMACERGADRAARQGPALIEAGRKALASGSIARMSLADRRFHEFIYELSGNPLIGPTMAHHWLHIQRVMGAVLARDDDAPSLVWDEHQALLEAIVRADAPAAQALAQQHLLQAAELLVRRLAASG